MRLSLIFPNTFTAFPATRTHQPLALAYLASVAREAGHVVQLVDATARRLRHEKIVAELVSFKPDVIGITTNVGMAAQALTLARYLKKHDVGAKLVLGGPWATIEYARLLNHGLCDIVVIGEGERTLVHLLRTMEGNSDLHSVPGIAFKDQDNEVISTPPRPLIQDLDSLPFPAWDFFPASKKYRFLRRASPFFPVITSRGCPHDCIHCTKAVHGYKYRTRSPENVIAEIRYLKEKFNVKEIFIIDDNFNHDITRAERILDGIIKGGFNIKIKFTNGLRADKMTASFVERLHRAGTYGVTLGIESGNQTIVNSIGKNLDLRHVITAKHMLKKRGIVTGGFFMLGHPEDTKQTMLQTVAFAKKLDIDYPFFFKAVPFPGTKMHDMVKKHGSFIPERETTIIEKYNVKTAAFEMWNVTAEDVMRVFNLAYRTFYLRPWKILRLLAQYRSFMEFFWVLDTVLKILVKNA